MLAIFTHVVNLWFNHKGGIGQNKDVSWEIATYY